MRAFATAAFLLGTVLAPLPALAQDHPDLTGFWAPGFGDMGDGPPDLLAKLPQGAVVIDDSGAAEFPRGEFGGLVLQPDALERAQKWSADDEMTLTRVCLPPSIVYGVQGPFPWEIIQTDELIVFKYEYFDQVRLIFMDGRDHPGDDYPHTKMGFSTGYWDGDELVVDTTHLAESTITNNGLDHSEDIRMQERYRLTDDGTRLVATQWFSDPQVLVTDGARYMAWDKREGEHIFPYECDPSFALEYQDMKAAQ